jgi:thiol-disulfide isomerase/thioredoxin
MYCGVCIDFPFVEEVIMPSLLRAPEFPSDLDWLNSAPLRLADLTGQVVLLEFWTSYCINCLHNLPELERLREQFGPALRIIGVHTGKFAAEHDTAFVAKMLERYDITWPVVNDAAQKIWSSYAVRAWPTTVLINQQGRIAKVHSGEFVAEDFAPIISELFERLGYGTMPLKDDLNVSHLRHPSALAAKTPEHIFVADTGNNRVLECWLDGESLQVFRSFGSGLASFYDGIDEQAAFRQPRGLALHGDTLFVADTGNHAIRAIDLNSGEVTTVAGTGNKARRAQPTQDLAPLATDLRSPWALAHDGERLLIAMAGSHQIWALDHELRLWAGLGYETLVDGPRLTAGFSQPQALALNEQALFVADSETSAIRRIDRASGEVTTLAGLGLFQFGDQDGVGDAVLLQHPGGLAANATHVLIADSFNHKIKQLDLASGAVSTLIGNGQAGTDDGSFAQAQFNQPEGLVWLDPQRFLIADMFNDCIRLADLQTQQIRTLSLESEKIWADIRHVQLREVVVSKEPHSLSLHLQLPSGFTLNPDTPVQIELGNTRLQFAANDPLLLPIDPHSKPYELAVNLRVFLCDDQRGLCWAQQHYERWWIQPDREASESKVTLSLPKPL